MKKMPWKVEPLGAQKKLVMVGCGGTGGFVAEGLCRLLVDDLERIIILIDPDRVEPHNLRRQNFYRGDIGKHKARVLAERLSRQYGRRIGYFSQPFSGRMGVPCQIGMSPLHQDLIIGCVDNAAARRSIAEALQGAFGWWLDAGNGEHSGQVLFGNCTNVRFLEGAFRGDAVKSLPAPTLQQPALLVPVPRKKTARRDCAAAVAADEQSPVINQAMASLVLTFVHKLLTGTLTWMGAYLDLESGSLSTVPAEPSIVSRLTGLTEKQLVYKPRYKAEATG